MGKKRKSIAKKVRGEKEERLIIKEKWNIR